MASVYVYIVWLDRNSHLFLNKQGSEAVLVYRIVDNVTRFQIINS